MTQQHQAVRLDARVGFEGVEEGLYARGVDALGCGGARGQGTHAGILPRFGAMIERASV
ncbi:hypothetical protein [Streptomyces shaanxiensis]